MLSYAALSPPSSLEKSLVEDIRGLGFFGLVTVELPISCKIPLDSRLLVDVMLCFRPEGETFSASDEHGLPLADDQLLEDIDFGVTFLVGTAAPRKPALRSCSRLVCREVPGRESGLAPAMSLSSSSTSVFCLAASNAGECKSIRHRRIDIPP
jgi:hypothetical protein